MGMGGISVDHSADGAELEVSGEVCWRRCGRCVVNFHCLGQCLSGPLGCPGTTDPQGKPLGAG